MTEPKNEPRRQSHCRRHAKAPPGCLATVPRPAACYDPSFVIARKARTRQARCKHRPDVPSSGLDLPLAAAQCLTKPFRSSIRAIRAACRMGYKVHVYMNQPPSHVAIDVGEAELSLRPTLVQQVSFEHQGKVETGLIERIDPPDWENRGVVPNVYVVLNPSE